MTSHPNRGRPARALRAKSRALRLGYDIYQGRFTERWHVLAPAGKRAPAAPPGGFETAEDAWLAIGVICAPGGRGRTPKRDREAARP